MLKKLIVALGVTTPVLLAGNVLAAILPNLTPGSQFRYVFITSGTRDALSEDIADYNTFVNTEASSGSSTSTIPGTWAAIGSMYELSARDNTATTGTGGVPIYRVDGTLVANDYGDLWDGDIANPINVTQNGSIINTPVWTGTDANGSIHFRALGDRDGTRRGITSASTSAWIDSDTSFSPSDPLPFYAMSSIQEIEDEVIPEPTTIIASLLVGAGLLPLKGRKSKKTQ